MRTIPFTAVNTVFPIDPIVVGSISLRFGPESEVWVRHGMRRFVFPETKGGQLAGTPQVPRLQPCQPENVPAHGECSIDVIHPCAYC